MSMIPSGAVGGVVGHMSTQAAAAALVRKAQATRHAEGVDGMAEETIAESHNESGGNGGGEFYGGRKKDSVEIEGIEVAEEEGGEEAGGGVGHLDISA